MAYVNPRASQEAKPLPSPNITNQPPVAYIRGVPQYANPTGHGDPIPGNTPGTGSLNATRNMLIQHGYNVDPTGASTPRLVRALAHFKTTNGKGVALWNSQNPTLTQQHQAAAAAATSSPTTVAHGTAPANGGRAPATTVPANGVHKGVQQANPYAVNDPTVPQTTVDGSGALPANITQLLASYQKSLNPANIDLQKPTIDPQMYAKAQANMEYGPVIGNLQDQIGQLQGSEPGTQANIASYYKPVSDQAAAATAAGQASGAQNVQDQTGLAAKIAASLNLTGAGAGGLANAGAAQSGFAAQMAQLMNQQNQNQQVAVANNQQQAQTTESSNNENNVANLRSQLLGNIAAKGNAQSKYQTDAQALKQQEQTNYINNEGTLLNQKTTAALALPQIASAYQGLTKNQQGIASTAALLPGQVQNQNDTHALNTQRLLINGVQATTAQKEANANIFRTLHPNAASDAQTPWHGVSVANKVALGNQLHALFHTAPGPNAALKGMTDYVKNQLGYSGPNVAKYIQSVVTQNWGPKNPNLTFNGTTWINKKTGKPAN